MNQATYYQKKAKFGDIGASDIRRLKELEEENSKLKRMFTNLGLKNEALKDIIAKKL